jgi:predicted DNA-binding transcriptional regulator YafY
MAISQTERVLNLLAYLAASSGPVTRQDIFNDLSHLYPSGPADTADGENEARRTMFERDKSLLKSIGVEFTTRTLAGDQAGMTAYALDKSAYSEINLNLTDDEMKALQVAAAMVQIDMPWSRNALLWLGGEAPSADAASAAHISLSPAALPDIRSAAASNSTITFAYHGTKREVHPYGIVYRNGFWYLVAFEPAKNDQRVFRVDRIEGSVTIGEAKSFERPADFNIATAYAGDPKKFGQAEPGPTAVVRIDAPLAHGVERELGSSSVLTRHEDGAIEVSVPCGNTAGFHSWLFAMVDKAEVVSPPAVREEVRNALLALMANSKGGAA